MTRDKTSDRSEWLLAAARKGDSSAFGKLFERFQRRFKAIAGKYGLQDQSAADVLQDALMAAWTNIGTCRAETIAQWYAWFSRIVWSKACTHATKRRRIREHERPLPEGSSGGERLEGTSPRPSEILAGREDEAGKRELAARMFSVIEHLPDDYRQVLTLRLFEKLPYDDIAERMKRKPEAVRQLWCRAVRQCREKLEINDEC